MSTDNAGVDGPRTDRKAARRWCIALAKVALTVAATWLIMRGMGLRLAQGWTVNWTLVQFDFAFLALSMGLLFATFVVAAALWSRFVVEFGDSDLALTTSTALLLVANLGRYVPGKVLHLAGLAMLSRRAGLSGGRAAAAAVAAQILTLFSGAVIGGWVAYSSADLAGKWSLALGLVIVLGLAAFVHVGGAGAVLRWILKRSRYSDALPDADGRRLLRWLPGYFLHWLVHGAAFACLARGLGLEVPFGVAVTTFAAAYFIGYVAVFAPAGIGVRESTLAGLLGPILGAEASIVLAVLQRVWVTAADVVGAAAGGLVLRRAGLRTTASPPAMAEADNSVVRTP